MSTQPARQPKGIPVGGQFAHTSHAEPSVSLSAPKVWEGFVAERLRQTGRGGFLDGAVLADATDRLNEGRDFTDEAIIRSAGEAYEAQHGHTLQDAVAAKSGAEALRGLGRHEAADAIERILGHQPETVPTAPPHRPSRPVVPQPDPEECQDPHCRETNWGGTNRRHLRGPECPPAKPDGKTVPMPSWDWRVRQGEVFDLVEVEGHGTFHRLTEDTFPNEPYAMRVQTNRKLTDEEKRHLAGLLGYGYASTLRGEELGEPVSDTDYSFVVSADSTKSSSDDIGHAFEKFHDMIPELIQDGSPVRKTNNKGPGTRGTRAVEGFNEPDLKLELYYDSVL